MRTLRLAAGLTMLLLMSGCASELNPGVAAPVPVASPPSDPTPEPTADATVTTAVIFGSTIEWRNAAGDVLDSVRYDAGLAEFTSTMAKHFGAADGAEDDGTCSSLIYEGHFVVAHQTGWPVEIIVSASKLNGIRIETPSGISVGEDATALIEETVPELKRDLGAGTPDGSYPYWSVIFDAVGTWGEGTAEPNRYGARALIEEGTLYSIMVPGSLGSMHTSC